VISRSSSEITALQADQFVDSTTPNGASGAVELDVVRRR